MITWNNVTSDISYSNINEITRTLSPIDVIKLVNMLNNQPLVLVNRKCLTDIYKHVTTSSNELGGLLIGNVLTNPKNNQPNIIVISDTIASLEYDSTNVSLRMDSTIWNIARNKINTGFVVVGWYHSHPNLGAFFSGTDRHNQKNNFNHVYSIGYVIDPYRNDTKWYIGPSSDEIASDRIIIKE